MAVKQSLPIISIVGRANVGKSTLFNRITGRRRALVSREPGMTRDRRIEKAEWLGRHFNLVDTGGLQGEEDTLSKLISVQVRKAVSDSDLILFVVDASWSMAVSERMQATKGAIMSLLGDAYQRRDRVGLPLL